VSDRSPTAEEESEVGVLDGRVAIVTGGGGGLGREEALFLAAEGASVVVNDLGCELDGIGRDSSVAGQVAAEIGAQGGRAVANSDDITDYDAAGRLVDQAVDEFGRLDILVNSAGILRDRMLFNMSPEDFDAVVIGHLRLSFNTMRHASAHWRERSKAGEPVSGRIINTSSPSGLLVQAGQTNYSPAKAAVATMTLVASLEMQRYGVTANALAPTARTRLMQGAPMGDGSTVDGWHPLDPGNVAPLVAFLASDAAADITGQVFGVFAGVVQLYEGWRPVRTIRRSGPGPFTVAELSARRSELFGDTPPAFTSRMGEISREITGAFESVGLSR
jgi:NAD(P)-dependent dehydrogenase (short-subunit alcohol dehydrogenase family)